MGLPENRGHLPNGISIFCLNVSCFFYLRGAPGVAAGGGGLGIIILCVVWINEHFCLQRWPHIGKGRIRNEKTTPQRTLTKKVMFMKKWSCQVVKPKASQVAVKC